MLRPLFAGILAVVGITAWGQDAPKDELEMLLDDPRLLCYEKPDSPVIYASFHVINAMLNIPIEDAKIEIYAEEEERLNFFTDHKGKVLNVQLKAGKIYDVKTTKGDMPFHFDRISTLDFFENTLIMKEYYLSPQGAPPFIEKD